MRIALLSVSSGPTRPPSDYGYGGMERVNWWLCEELRARGHDVVLFVTKGSIPPNNEGMVLYPPGLCSHNQITAKVRETLDRGLALWFEKRWLGGFDVIHDSSHRHPIAKFCKGPILATMHNPNPRNLWGVPVKNLVALSPSHSAMYGGVPWVFNGVRDGAIPANVENRTGPFLFMSVITAYKGALETVQAAITAKEALTIAGTQWGGPIGKKCKEGIYHERCSQHSQSHWQHTTGGAAKCRSTRSLTRAGQGGRRQPDRKHEGPYGDRCD